MSFHPGLLAGFPRPAPEPEPPVVGDPNWANVALLISAEGRPTGAQAYGNVADAAVVCGRGSTAPLVSATTSPFTGGQSFRFGLIDSRRAGVKVSGSPASLTTGPFTLEGWAYANAWTSTSVIASAYLSGGSSWDFRYNTGSLEFRYFDGSGVQQSGTFALPSALTWFHWCIERDGAGDVRVYINGSMVLKRAASVFQAPGTSNFWWLGTTNNGGLSDNYFDGYLTEVRLTKAALYASDAGLVVPSEPFEQGDGTGGDPHWGDVVYLSQDHSDDASYANLGNFTDRSVRGLPFSSANGATFSTAAQRGARLGDWLFSGGSFDTRAVPNADLLNFYDRTIPFAAEAFIRPDAGALSGDRCIVGIWGGVGTRQWILILDNGRPTVMLSTDGSAITEKIATNALSASTWYHIALTRNASAVYRIYVNGALVATLDTLTGSNLFNVPTGSATLMVGSYYGGSNAWFGHMHGIRVTHGVDRYFDTDGFISAWPENVDQFPAYAAAA